MILFNTGNQAKQLSLRNEKATQRLQKALSLRGGQRPTWQSKLLQSLHSLAMTLFLSLLLSSPVFANEIGNASFESSFGGAGNWDNTANRGITQRTATDAPDGASYLRLDESGIGGAETASFTFQRILSEVHPGDTVAVSGMVRQTADDGNDEAQIVIEFNDSNDNQISNTTSTTITAGSSSSTFARTTVNTTAPGGTSYVVVTLRIQNGDLAGTATADFDSINATINGYPIDLGIDTSKSRIPKGGAAFVTVDLKNQTAVSQASVQLVVNVPNGLNILDDSTRVTSANNQIPNYEGSGARFFNLGTIGPEDNQTLSFLIAVSPGVVIGHRYNITLFAQNTSAVLSQTRHIPITIIADPFFDEGTVIGKVFDDQNENGIQDSGERGIPGVRLATEEGIVIKTDKDGKYHIPGVQPGRHLIKIDGHTLPTGTKFVTEETVLIRSTEGILSKADFAVKLPASKVSDEYKDDLNVYVSQTNDFAKPKLQISMNPNILKIGQGMLEQQPAFLIDTNYANMIAAWRVEVKDTQGNEIWTGHGLGAPPQQAPWSGFAKNRKIVDPGVYCYRLVVRDAKNHEDWTPLQFFKAVSKLSSDSENESIELPSTGFTKIQQDGKRSIPISAKPTILVRGQAAPDSEVNVNGKAVSVNSDGSFETHVFTEPGTQPIQVQAKSSDGKTLTYKEEVPVKDTSFFMVALGEEEIGGNTFNGNFETVGRDDQFHEGFYQKGKLAYYLKGKIKGKFLVTSRYDTTSPERQALFTNLDPDHYYPVYGDGSEINYDARDTQEKFYILAEMDRSYAKYGSYQTNFSDTELSTYNRALSGFKVHHEVLDTNQYGDSKRAITVFAAQAKSLSDRNEFLGTGGSLYYLRNKNVVQGSEQVHVEIRDKLQGITIYKKDLVNGTDYEIDYPQGRILLRKPLSSVSYTDTILSNDVLNGSQVYLTVEYEFEASDLFGDQPAGVRGYTYMGDHLKVGGTAVREKRQDREYDLRGVDATLKLGKNTKIAAEYAQTQEAQSRNSVSYNGGITFKDLANGNRRIKKSEYKFDPAWSLRAESQPLKNTSVSGYMQQINQGFSNTESVSQKGELKSGFEVKQQLTKDADVRYRFDRLRDRETVSNPDILAHTLQTHYDDGEYLAVAEYRNSDYEVNPRSARGLEPIFERQEFRNGYGLKLGYHMDNGWTPYTRAQATSGSKPNNQFGAGLEANLKDRGTVRFEEMVGNLGESTLIGYERQVNDRTSVYSNMKSGPSVDGLGRGLSTTIGSSHQVNENSRIYTEREASSYEIGEKSGDLAGYDLALSEKWNVGFSGERSRIHDIKDDAEIEDHPDVSSDYYNVERTAGAVEVSYLDSELLKIINRFELRFDRGDSRRNQWLSSNSLEWKINPDYTYLARVNKSITTRTSGEGNLDGDFIELNTGVAYRPVNHNKLNVLTRYTWLQDIGSIGQYGLGEHNGVQTDERSQILGIEGAYDIHKWFGLVQKFGYKMGGLRSAAAADWIQLGTFLSVSRINFHITRKWDLAAEYRIRFDHRVLDAMTSGFLFEVDREFYEYVRLGVGYNFTDFSDDLRQSNAYNNHGFFTRVSGKF